MSRNIGIGEVRTKLLDTDHKQWNCGMGLYDPNKVFFREDPNGKVIVDGKLCSIVRSKSESNLIMIGGKFYKFVQIGDQIWLAENLELPFVGAVYYNNDPAQSYGLLYRGQDMGALNDYLLENNVGWHVPTLDELNILISTAGGQSVAGTHLKSTTSWNSGNSDNSTGFDLKAAGLKVGNTYNYKGTDTTLWSCVLLPDSSAAGRMPVDANPGAYTTTLNWNYCASVRLIKDTVPVTVGGKIYHTAKIGSQIWTIENLDFVPEGVELKTSGSDVPSTPMCCYYNYTPNDKGLLYNAYTFDAIKQQIPTGWKLPTTYDYETLFAYIGGNTVDNIKKLRSTSGWPNTQGTNAYRLSLVPNGNRGTNGAFITPTTCYLWTNTGSTETYNRISINDTSSAGTSSFVKEICYSIRLIKETEPIEIGGRKYKTTKIGNQLWMSENLDYIFEGLNVGGATLQDDIHAWYYNNDPAQSEGLLYNGYAAKYLAEHPELLPEGWKVPEPSDFGVLQNAVGGANIAGNRLKNPGTMNGINYCDFNGLATGMIRSNGAFTDRNTYLRLWTPNISQTDETAQLFLTLESDKTQATVVSFPNDQTVAYSIRLVKNLSDENSLSKGLLSTIVEKGKEDIDEKSVEEEKKTEEVIEEKEIIKEENKR